MPHSHDIVGPCTARGTSHSLVLLLHIAHTALEPAGQDERRGYTPPSQSGSDSRLFHKRTRKKKKKTWLHTLPLFGPISQVRNCLLGNVKYTFNQASDLFFWSGGVYWKTIIWAWARLSRRAIIHWRDSLTMLTFGFSKSLGVKWGGQHWASSILGEGPVDE